MEFKNLVKKEIKKTFFPYKGVDELTQKIEENFTKGTDYFFLKGSYYTVKAYGKKIIIAYSSKFTLVFLEGNDDLVVLIISDFKGFYKPNISHIETRSVTRVDIVCSDGWANKNEEILEITELISNSSSHLGNEYLIKGNKDMNGFSLNHLKSPLFWYLLRDRLSSVPYSKNQSSKTKNNFVSGITRVILNRLNSKLKIEDKDIYSIKQKMFVSFTTNLLNRNTRHFYLEDLKSRNGVIFQDILYPELFSSVNYNREDWNILINGELIPNLKYDYLDYLFDLIVSSDSIDEEIFRHILSEITRMSHFKKLKEDVNVYPNIDKMKSFLLQNNKENLIDFMNTFISFVDEVFKFEFFSSEYEKRTKKTEAVLFKDNWMQEFSEKFYIFLQETQAEPTEPQTINPPYIAINDEEIAF